MGFRYIVIDMNVDIWINFDQIYYDSIIICILVGYWGELKDFKGLVVFLFFEVSFYIIGEIIVVSEFVIFVDWQIIELDQVDGGWMVR